MASGRDIGSVLFKQVMVSTSFRAVDLVKGAAVSEVCLVRLLPAAEKVFDGERFHLGKVSGMFLRDGFEARTEEIARDDFLAFGRVEIFEVSLGNGFIPVTPREA